MRASAGVLVVLWVASACAGKSENSSNDPASSPSAAATTTGADGVSSSTVAGGVQTSGSSNNTGGVAAVTATASGGSGGTNAGAGGLAGADGSASSSGGSSGGADTTPRPCNSSDGSGCNQGEVCLDLLSDACSPGTSTDCTGYCASTLTPSTCEGGLAQCHGTVTCPALPPECPEGFVNSVVDECWGSCVPADCCACSAEDYCLLNDVSCDLSTGRCVVPAAPEPRCFLPPPDADDCPGEAPSFVFVDGECQARPWGVCDDSYDNRFDTIEECVRRCQGLPQQGECPQGRVPRQTCLACGAGGGCRQTATVCAQPCETNDDC